jgi:hypothetical protein
MVWWGDGDGVEGEGVCVRGEEWKGGALAGRWGGLQAAPAPPRTLAQEQAEAQVQAPEHKHLSSCTHARSCTLRPVMINTT